MLSSNQFLKILQHLLRNIHQFIIILLSYTKYFLQKLKAVLVTLQQFQAVSGAYNLFSAYCKRINSHKNLIIPVTHRRNRLITFAQRREEIHKRKVSLVNIKKQIFLLVVWIIKHHSGLFLSLNCYNSSLIIAIILQTLFSLSIHNNFKNHNWS